MSNQRRFGIEKMKTATTLNCQQSAIVKLGLYLTFCILLISGLVNAQTSNSLAKRDRAIAAGIANPVTGPVTSSEGKRVALIIGNSQYVNSPLANPVNDAKSMASSLTKLGFDVIEVLDLDKAHMQRAAQTFIKKIENAEVGLFFFAGHGMQVKGKNYLIPVNHRISSEKSVPKESFSANDLMRDMERTNVKTSIIILDACRNNPFEPSSRSFNSSSAGLARMDAPTGSIVIYATAPGKTASDGKGKNGLFTGHFLNNLNTPGASIYDISIATRRAVMEASNGKQVPWELSSLVEQFYFQASNTQTQLASINSQSVNATSSSRPLTVLTKPSKAKVTLLNSTQTYKAGVNLPIGKYQVQASLDGYETMTREVDLNKSGAYEFVLSPSLSDQTYTVNGETFSMIAVPGGEFMMGCKRADKNCPRSSENPQKVYVDGFRMMETEVTMALYKKCVDDGVCSENAFKNIEYSSNKPISQVSFFDITEAFIPWLEYKTNARFSLPSDAQWEYTFKSSPVNFASERACRFAHISGASKNGCEQYDAPTKVKSYKANGFGIYDLFGNVAEMTQDCYTRDISSVPLDGTAQTGGDCNSKIYRGASYDDNGRQANPMKRLHLRNSVGKANVGFRLVQSASMVTN